MSSKPGSSSDLPALDWMDGWVRAYGRAWRRHADTMNEVWSEVVRADAPASAWTSGCSKLLQSWTEGARDLLGAAMAGGGAYTPQSQHTPLLAFALDRAAQASAQPIPLSLPLGVTIADLDWTPLRTNTDPPIVAAESVGITGQDGCTVDVSILGAPQQPSATNKDLTYVSFVVSRPPEPGALADPTQTLVPPRTLYAIITLTFV